MRHFFLAGGGWGWGWRDLSLESGCVSSLALMDAFSRLTPAAARFPALDTVACFSTRGTGCMVLLRLMHDCDSLVLR